jgi:hypothetical protein
VKLNTHFHLVPRLRESGEAQFYLLQLYLHSPHVLTVVRLGSSGTFSLLTCKIVLFFKVCHTILTSLAYICFMPFMASPQFFPSYAGD